MTMGYINERKNYQGRKKRVKMNKKENDKA